MLLPVHDQNNHKVTITPIISYLIIVSCVILFAYQSIIFNTGRKEEEKLVGIMKLANFNQKFGLVPGHYLKKTTNFPLLQKETIEPIIMGHRFVDKEAFSLIRENLDVESTPMVQKLTPISYCFLHANLLHLLGNLWFFWIFSDNVEERLGSIGFLLFYIGVGALSGLGHAYLNKSSLVPLIGASGAISGVMGAYMVFFPKNLITSFFCPIWFYIRKLEVPAFVVLGFYIIINFFQATTTASQGVSVAFDCHVVGFIVGAIFAFFITLLAPPKSQCDY